MITTASSEPAVLESTGETSDTMMAIVQDNYGSVPGDVLRLAEVDRPTVGDDEVLVRVGAASVDRGTVHLMTGMPALMRLLGFGFRRPKAPNPGRSLAGTVEAVGHAVTGFEVGDEVYGAAGGTFAEYAVVNPGRLAHKPVNLSVGQAAAVPISGMTAAQAVRLAQVEAGQRVLITGASGGVGTFAVQLAKAAGAEVTGVCSTSKTDLVLQLGADHVVDYTREDFTASGQRYDAIIDIAGNTKLAHLRRALEPKGRLVLAGGETEGRLLGGFDRQIRALLLSPFVGEKLAVLAAKENADDLTALRSVIEAGNLAPSVDRSFPLSETPAAIGYVQQGHARGKVVITV